jgi:hypothetical protein
MSITALGAFQSELHRLTSTRNTNSSVGFNGLFTAMTQQADEVAFCAERYLRGLFPNLRLHVADSSGFTHWERADFPHHLLFQDTIDDDVVEYLNAWKPTRRTATGFEPDVQRNLETIPRGLHVVLIHPATKERMNNNPEYARIIAGRIQGWFNYDVLRNRAIDQDSMCPTRTSQLICINEDGSLGHKVTVGEGGGTKYGDGSGANAAEQHMKMLRVQSGIELERILSGLHLNIDFNRMVVMGEVEPGR